MDDSFGTLGVVRLPSRHYPIALFHQPFGIGRRWGVDPMSTMTVTQSKQLTKKELKKFQELLE
ncbi:MAG TPA: hypothetical protein VFT22_38760, partial [Kofleriaceae bacterium]|nr:hypothetical protein [Kofleriaceae bacterium]